MGRVKTLPAWEAGRHPPSDSQHVRQLIIFKVLLMPSSCCSFEFWPHAVVNHSSHPLGDEPHVFGQVFEVTFVKQLLREVFLPLDLAFCDF